MQNYAKISIYYRSGVLVQMTQNYIELQDETRQHYRLLFQDCVDGWIKYVQTSGEFSINTKPSDTSKCVAMTDASTDAMFIEFMGIPSIRIIFRRSWRLWEPMRAFVEFKYQLCEHGWTTYDMS